MAFDSTIATATIYMEASGEGFEGICEALVRLAAPGELRDLRGRGAQHP